METDHIGCVRSFNRTVTQRIGALNNSFLDLGRPLGEARLLYEIGPDGREVSVLREKLALDSGYLSRLLRSLERQGLVRTRRGAGDGRGRYVEPTRKGVDELEEYRRRSDGFARSLLLPLSSSQRHRLVAAMAEVERLMRAAAVEIKYKNQIALRPSGVWKPLSRTRAAVRGRVKSGTALPLGPEKLIPPTGCFIVAYLDGAPIGCRGALETKGCQDREMGRSGSPLPPGVSASAVAYSCRWRASKEFGLGILRLDTNKALKEAQNLYRTSGYRRSRPVQR